MSNVLVTIGADEDPGLGARIVRPDSDGFERFYADSFPRLVTALQISGATLQQAEDSVQEAFARTYLKWPRIETGTNPTGYVYRVAIRLHRRSRLRPSFPTAPPVPSDLAATTVTAIVIRQTIAAMPLRQRHCVALCLLLDLDPNQAARILKIRASTVRTHLHNGRRALAKALE